MTKQAVLNQNLWLSKVGELNTVSTVNKRRTASVAIEEVGDFARMHQSENKKPHRCCMHQNIATNPNTQKGGVWSPCVKPSTGTKKYEFEALLR